MSCEGGARNVVGNVWKKTISGGAILAVAMVSIGAASQHEIAPPLTSPTAAQQQESGATAQIRLSAAQTSWPPGTRVLPSKAATRPWRSPAVPPASEPNTADGRPILQLGLSGWGTGSLEEPFLNLFRMTGNDWTAVRNFPDGTTLPMAELLAGGFLDPETLLPRAVPPGFDAVRSGLFRGGVRHDPAAYAGTYVVEWEGEADARVRLGCATSQKRVAANRIELDCPETDKAWTQIWFSGLGPGGLKAVRVFRKEDEARVKAGEVFSPRFLAYAGRYKVLRTLDGQGANISGARSVDRLGKKAHAGWGASHWFNDDGLPMGPPIEALFDLAVAADAALWMHVAGPIGAPPEIDPYNLRDGPLKKDIQLFTKAHAAEILGSPEWDRYADEIVRSAVASRYPETRTLYIEIANEVWNNANPFWWSTRYYSGLNDYLKENGGPEGFGSKVAHGYVTGLFAVAFDKALARAGRSQAVVFVLAGQHANPTTTRSMGAGFRYFFERQGIDPAPYLARAGLATATYFGEGTSKVRGLFKAASDDEMKTKWLAAIESDPQGTAKALTDWYLTVDQCCTIPYLVRLRKAHEAVAAAAGIRFIGDYEGESHEAASPVLRDDPTFRDWYFTVWMDGPEGERLTREWVRALYEENPAAILANYKGACVRQIRKPWCDGLIGQDTGRARGLEYYLRE